MKIPQFAVSGVTSRHAASPTGFSIQRMANGLTIALTIALLSALPYGRS